MHTLRTLSALIEKEIKIEEFDVVPQYFPHSKNLIELSHISIDIIIRDFDIMMESGCIKKLKLKKTIPIFRSALLKVKKDLNQNGRWSFWHFALLMIITSINYAYLGKQGKFKTIDLNKQETWDNPNFEVAVIAINIVAQKLYPSAMAKLVEIANKKDVDINIMCNTLLRNITLLS